MVEDVEKTREHKEAEIYWAPENVPRGSLFTRAQAIAISNDQLFPSIHSNKERKTKIGTIKTLSGD